MKKLVPRFTMLLLFTFVVSSCVVQRSPVTGNKRAYGYSWAQELQIGAEADPHIVAQYGLYDDPEIQAYVKRIGEEVLANSHLRRPDAEQQFRDAPFTFRVLDSPIVNAFALPGGYVYVTRGLLAHVESEAQLAVVLGHEVGHVAGRHGSKRAATAQFGQLGLIAGAVIGQEVLGLPAGDLLSTGSSVAQLMFLRYGRDDERESDLLGVEYAALSGYQAEEGAAFFTTLKRLSDKAGQSIPSMLSTHPDPGEREQTIRKLAAEWESQVSMTKLGANEHLRMIDNIVIGDDPRQGYVENGTFFHPQLKFLFPVAQEFQVINQPTQVAMVDKDQKAVMIMTIAQNVSSAKDAAQKFRAQEGLTIVDAGSSTSGILPSEIVIADAAMQNGGEVRLAVQFTEYGGNVYQILGYSAKADFANWENKFGYTMRGFGPLSDPSKINVSPNRLKVISATSTGPFNRFVPSNLPTAFTAEDIAILNQVGMTQTVPAGEMLKIVQ